MLGEADANRAVEALGLIRSHRPCSIFADVKPIGHRDFAECIFFHTAEPADNLSCDDTPRGESMPSTQPYRIMQIASTAKEPVDFAFSSCRPTLS